MAFLPRSLAAISAAIRGDLRRELPGTDATIWPNTLTVFSKVVAMANHLVEQRAAWIYRQIFTSTADARHLERHAYEYGMARKAASRASGRVATTGTPNAVYPAGIGYLSGGETYRTAGDARADGAGAVVFEVYSERAGAAMNRAEGEALTLADPALYPSLGSEATVAAGGLGGGADVEGDELLRARILDRKRRPPQGGATSDYEQLARSFPGVTKAWARSFAHGPGTVGVWFLFEGRPSGIPTGADVEALADYIEARRLIRADLVVQAPIPTPVAITIANLVNDTAATRAAIEASLAAMFLARARPGVAADPLVFSRSWIAEAISQAVGEDRHVLVSPAADLVYAAGQYPVLGAIAYA